jgi:hypothetical protein
MTAREAREAIEKAREAKIAERFERASEYCELIGKQIEAKANEEKSQLTVKNISSDIYYYIINILKENGYSLKPLENEYGLIVRW